MRKRCEADMREKRTAVDTSVWYCVDNVYDSADPGVVGAQQARNVWQADGALQIVARKESVPCLPTQGAQPVMQEYTIGVIYTKPFSFTYGEVEVRAKMTGPGTWPAAWLMDARCQENYWIIVPVPRAEIRREIDFAEYMPGASKGSVNKIWHNVHNFEAGRTQSFEASVDDVRKWHVYRVEWTPSLLVFKIDGVETFRTTQDVPDVPEFLNLGFTGLKGPLGGELDDRTLPQTMYVDYARVRQNGKIIFEDDFGGPCPLP
jgi:beta-glucanase (GH16 family)